MKSLQATIQIGKNGLTSGIVETIKKAFKNRGSVKIHLLKSAGHDREKVKEIAEKIQQELGKKYAYRILGFSIFFRKLKK